MKELEDIVKAFDKATQQGLRTALATVVHVEGSAYRQPGARMLVTENGELTGAISGGCLEGDALRKAQLVIMQQQPMLVTYDTTDEDDAQLGVGLGCNGIIHILLEPVDTQSPNNPVQLIKLITSNRQESILITLFNKKQRKGPQAGTVLLRRDAFIDGTPENTSLYPALLDDSLTALHSRSSIVKNFLTGDQELSALFSYIAPALQLIIGGAGNDAQPVLQLATVLGWHCTLIDGRPAYATSQRFPGARIIITKASDVLQHITPDDFTAAILMSHNYNYDLTMLKNLIQTSTPYIGVLGPAKKLRRMLDESEGISHIQQARIYGPAGLDIGANTPEEIALSIISEIKKVISNQYSNYTGQSLRDKNGTIHNRASQVVISQKI
ncbi:XdhC family protein [Chitinophaga sp. Cy-1792]|nr:XdhC family protein [Chitinophaga sp. Cy-1792]